MEKNGLTEEFKILKTTTKKKKEKKWKEKKG